MVVSPDPLANPRGGGKSQMSTPFSVGGSLTGNPSLSAQFAKVGSPVGQVSGQLISGVN